MNGLINGNVVSTAKLDMMSQGIQRMQSVTMHSLMDLLQASTGSLRGMVFAASSSGVSANSLEATTLTYQSLLDIAERNAWPIRKIAKENGASIVLIHQDTIADNIKMFWSVVRAGLTPAMSTPLSADPQQRLTHIQHLKTLLNDPICLTSEALAAKVTEFQILKIKTKESLAKEQTHTSLDVAEDSSSSIPALMLTSGSTGNAKAVELTAHQMLTSIRGKSENWHSDSNSVFLNWIGLDHVASLVEIHMQAMLHGAQQVHVQASDLLADPTLFLRLIDKHRVNYTFAPNFFLALLEKDLVASGPDVLFHSLDLSCLRSIMSGGEANALGVANRLTARLQDLGARGQVIRLGYGLTEACAAMAYGILDPEYEAEEQHEFASIGNPITGAQMRVRTDSCEADPYEVGNLEISGPVVFRQYFNNPTATREAFTSDGWFNTGDRAYVDKHGKFNLVGRSKEILNIHGMTFAPQDIETALEKANLNNVLASCYAAFPYRKQHGSTEGYCIVYSAKIQDLDTVEEIARISSSLVAVRPDWIIPLSQSRLDRSSLGKLSRTKIQNMFAQGAYDDVKVDSSHPLNLFRDEPRQVPQTSTQQQVTETLSEMLDLPEYFISTHQTIFELGITSVSLFRFEKLLRRKLQLGSGSSQPNGLKVLLMSLNLQTDNVLERHFDHHVSEQSCNLGNSRCY